MADKAQLMRMVDDELHAFVAAHIDELRDRDSSTPYEFALMMRFRSVLERLPLSQEKINVLVDLNSTNLLQTILYYQEKNGGENAALKQCSVCVDSYVEETYKEYRSYSLTDRIDGNNEEYQSHIQNLPPEEIIKHAGDLDQRNQIANLFVEVTNLLSLNEIEALLTLPDPLQDIYQEWAGNLQIWKIPSPPTVEDLASYARTVAEKQCAVLEQRTGEPENEDELLYRQNRQYASDHEDAIYLLSRMDRFWNLIDGEYVDASFNVEELGEKRLAQYDEIYGVLNGKLSIGPEYLEALLTYTKPMEQIMFIQEQYQEESVAQAVQITASARMEELARYMSGIGQLPSMLQAPVRDFQQQLETIRCLSSQEEQAAEPDSDAEEQDR